MVKLDKQIFVYHKRI